MIKYVVRYAVPKPATSCSRGAMADHVDRVFRRGMVMRSPD
jgi:hypothetical protein